MGYTGAGVRGDTSNDDYFDTYVGTYSASPVTSYCVDNATSTGYLNVDWNKQGTGELLMVGMPHHVRHHHPSRRLANLSDKNKISRSLADI